MGLFTPKWKSKHYQKAIHAVIKMTDQNVLKRVAAEAQFDDVRKEAVSRIKDQALLEEWAFHADQDIATVAVQALKNQEGLLRVAQYSKNQGVRIIAAKRADSSLVLNKIAMLEDPEIATAACKNITHPRILAEIARKAPEAGARKTAILRIKDQAILFEAAMNDPNEEVRKAAQMQLQDPAQIAFLAKRGMDPIVAQSLLSQLSKRQDLLMSIIAEGQDAEVRRIAISKISSQAHLANFVKKSPSLAIRSAAILWVQDQNLLAEIATTHSGTGIFSSLDLPPGESLEGLRLLAIQRLQDQELLQGLLMYESSMALQLAIINRLKDQNALIAFLDKACQKNAIDRIDSRVIRAAIEKITNIGYLAKIVQEKALYGGEAAAAAILVLKRLAARFIEYCKKDAPIRYLQALIELGGADVNQTESISNSENEDIGGDANTVTVLSPLYYAIENRNIQAVHLLRVKGARLDSCYVEERFMSGSHFKKGISGATATRHPMDLEAFALENEMSLR